MYILIKIICLNFQSYADEIITSFHLPAGVQMVKVYLKKDLYCTLHNAANIKWAVYNGVQKKFLQKV